MGGGNRSEDKKFHRLCTETVRGGGGGKGVTGLFTKKTIKNGVTPKNVWGLWGLNPMDDVLRGT